MQSTFATQGSLTRLAPGRSRYSPPLDSPAVDALRVMSDPRTPVFLTVHADGRRRYSYWQPFDPHTGRGSCYVALPTAACDALHHAARISLGEPVVDPARTTYRVRPVRTQAAPVPSVRPVRTVSQRARVA
ncbi:hypothetical protein AQI94_30930 [Streptomyces pseudovenezuelae]|uniref:Cell envelope biogenesis protein OmpA n=2 Tax=Streptomyces TaxID=1883 RepID=A0A101N1Q0_9ACTN|nr:hypothetical protein AQI94_30930 [Streptomyces pseudovenezuelae]